MELNLIDIIYLYMKLFMFCNVFAYLHTQIRANLFMGKHIQFFLHIIKFSYKSPPNYISDFCILEDGESVHLDWLFPPSIQKNTSLTPIQKQVLPPSLHNQVFPTTLEKDIILLINPGLLGNTKTLMGNWIKEAHKRNWTVCVHNRRGHDKLLTRAKWNIFGSVKDLKFITKNYIKKRYPNAKLLMLGISAGAGLTIRYFGEETGQYIAGACISGCYGIENIMNRPQFPYNWAILNKMKYFLQKNKHVLKNCHGFHACMKSKDPREFLDNVYNMAGYSSKEAFYNNGGSAIKTFKHIKTPLYLLNAEDDPIAVVNNCTEWLHTIMSNNKILFELTAYGSHCAFLLHNCNLFNALTGNSYAEDKVFEYFEKQLLL